MSDWRPHEPCLENTRLAEWQIKMNRCFLHDDCTAADEAVRRDPDNLDVFGNPRRFFAIHEKEGRL